MLKTVSNHQKVTLLQYHTRMDAIFYPLARILFIGHIAQNHVLRFIKISGELDSSVF